MVIHICGEPYDPTSPAACGATDAATITQRAAGNILIADSPTKLTKVAPTDLCPHCLELVARFVFELHLPIEKELQCTTNYIAPPTGESDPALAANANLPT